MKLSDVLKQSALITKNSGVTVVRDSAHSTVLIENDEGCSLLLQGQEADEFNDECERVYNEVQTLGMDIVELALAEPYLILLDE